MFLVGISTQRDDDHEKTPAVHEGWWAADDGENSEGLEDLLSFELSLE